MTWSQRRVRFGRSWPSLRTVGLGLRFVILIVFAAFFVVPIIWLVLAPTKTDAGLISTPPLSFGDFHNVVSAWNFIVRFEGGIVGTWMENSLLYVVSASAIVVATSIPAGYGLARSRFPGRGILLSTTLFVMIMPSASFVIPIYLEMHSLHLLGNSLSVILPLAFYPFGVFLAYIYFSTAIPKDLLDAARVDGGGEFQTFLRVALPLSRPIVALVFFFSFVTDWNNYFLPFVLINSSNQYSIQVGMAEILLQAFPRPVLALTILLSIIPVLLVFLFSQRYLIRGLIQGASVG